MSFLLFAAALIGTLLLSWLGVRFLIVYLVARDIVDRPNSRTLHDGVVPRGGGLVIVALLIIAMIGMALLSGRTNLFLSLALIVALWATLSWCDDRVDLSPRKRFGVQIVFAIVTVLAYGWIVDVQITTNYWLMISWFGLPLTITGVVWGANLYNFMDGMDGMAAAQTIVAATTFSFWFWQAGDVHLAFICAVLASAAYGFLLWNWQPAKIFMGDVGSVTIGAFFSMLVIIGVTRYEFSILSCVLLFSVFVCDTSITLLRRIWYKEKFWLPHRTHYYQRLAASGVNHSQIVLMATVLMLLCSLIATVSLLYRDMIMFGVIAVIALMGLTIFTVVYLERHNKKS